MNEDNTNEIIRLRRLLKELKKKEGKGTELISLYIPSERQMSDILNVLKNEYSQAGNIKDRSTRHNVQEALTSIIQRLKLFNKAPPNGLVVFAGYVDKGIPGAEEFEIHLIEPPYPINVYLYRCDSRFHTEILEETIKVGKKYGLLVLDREEASFAMVYGNNIEILETITSGIPGKHRAGGQSARRFERVIEVMTNEFYHRVAERAVKYFLRENVVDGLLVGGPGPTKNEFLDKDYLPTDLKKKVIDVIDLGYSGEEGIYELIERGKESLQKVEIVKQKEEVSNFLKYLTENPKQVSIGLNETLAALDKNLLLKILMPEDLEIIKLIYECLSCGNKEEILTHSEEIIKLKSELKCNKCNSTNLKFEEINETDNILEKIFESGTDLILLSKNLNEASSIKKSFGGIVGILKY